MSQHDSTYSLEAQIDQWRSYVLRRQAIHTVDVAELEDHLREQVQGLVAAGLAADEAFLIAVKRMGNLDALSREFAQEHSDRLWKQLVVESPNSLQQLPWNRAGALGAFAFAVLAALVIKIPGLFGIDFDEENAGFHLRNLGVLVLPVLTAYFAWKRQIDLHVMYWLAAVFIVAAVIANTYPVAADGHTETLMGLHLPVALWLTVGIAYAGKRWGDVSGRMDFIRFSGEFFIYFVLIAFGGGVLTGFMVMIFELIGYHLDFFVSSWLLPCGAAGAVIIASWLVEAKQSVIENMAPVLTRLFTPLFAAVLVIFLAALLWTGHGLDIEREVLIAFDLLLVLVLGLLLYSVSARDAQAPPGVFDLTQVVLVGSALLADVVALWAISARISEFGASPNRIAGLGVNLILLVNLAWSAALYIRFLRGRGPFKSLEQWQTNYLPVYALWAAIVVIVFPPAFGYV